MTDLTTRELLERHERAEASLIRLKHERACLIEVGAPPNVIAAIDREIAVAERLWKAAREMAARVAMERRVLFG